MDLTLPSGISLICYSLTIPGEEIGWLIYGVNVNSGCTPSKHSPLGCGEIYIEPVCRQAGACICRVSPILIPYAKYPDVSDFNIQAAHCPIN